MCVQAGKAMLAGMKWITCGALGLAFSAGALAADAYPSKPITLVVPFSAGGPTDVVSRALGQAMSKELGQSVVVENKLGAGGTVAAAFPRRYACWAWRPHSWRGRSPTATPS